MPEPTLGRVDLSPLIFVALAGLWLVYLVPKVRRHSDELWRSRPVDEISDQARVIARRDAVDSRSAAFVVNRTARSSAAVTEPVAATTVSEDVDPAEADSSGTEASEVEDATIEQDDRTDAQRKESARPTKRPAGAARRRRRVLGLLLLALLATVGTAVAGLIHPAWTALPGALVAAWLVACRLMVRRPVAARAPRTASSAGPEMVQVYDETGQLVSVPADVVPAESTEVPHVATLDPVTGSWDMVPMMLPTYVDKPAAARRSTRQLDHDSTGVWSSGRKEADSELARRAEQERRESAERARSAARRTGS